METKRTRFDIRQDYTAVTFSHFYSYNVLAFFFQVYYYKNIEKGSPAVKWVRKVMGLSV